MERRDPVTAIRTLNVVGLGVIVALLLLTAAGCSSVSICLEQEKGVSASEDARGGQNCRPPR
jgi:hypothetical protein